MRLLGRLTDRTGWPIVRGTIATYPETDRFHPIPNGLEEFKPMPLRSPELRGDPRLEACLVQDSAHVKLGDTGGFVAKIQAALLKVDGLSISPGELLGKRYGESTAAAVLKYKQKRRIINATYQSVEDSIVGKMTISALDADLLKKTPGKPSNGREELLIVPFTEPQPMLVAQKLDNRFKGDLNNTLSGPALPSGFMNFVAQERVNQARQDSTRDLELTMQMELLFGGSAGIQLFNDFRLNNVPKQVMSYGFDSAVAARIEASPEFKRVHEEVKIFVTDALSESAATGILDYHVLREPLKKVPPPLFSFRATFSLHVAIGSIQGVNLFLEDFSADAATRIYNATMIYELFDHFGVDDSDLVPDTSLHGSPGQVALWVLQRERHPGHQPYVVKPMIEKTISSKF